MLVTSLLLSVMIIRNVIEYITISLISDIIPNVLVYYICKWLDNNNKPKK